MYNINGYILKKKGDIMNTYERLLNEHGYCESLVGKDEDGEIVILSIDEQSADVTTLQANGWHRTNVYWKDGTQEEMYSK